MTQGLDFTNLGGNMADATANPSAADLPGSLSYASIDTALAAADVAYDAYSGSTMLSTDGTTVGPPSTSYESLIGARWTQIELPGSGEDVTPDHYQGVAFYKVINGITEVIVANRGTQPGGPSPKYDLEHSDALLAIGVEPPCDADALTCYQQVTAWLQQNVTGTVQIIETGHSLGGEEADYVQESLGQKPEAEIYPAAG